MIALVSFAALLFISVLGLGAIDKSENLQRACDWWINLIAGS